MSANGRLDKGANTLPTLQRQIQTLATRHGAARLLADAQPELFAMDDGTGELSYVDASIPTDALVLTLATTAEPGIVKQAVEVADVDPLIDSSGGASSLPLVAPVTVTVTDPTNAPADADALRDDLVATTIPSIEAAMGQMRDAIATLATQLNAVVADNNALKAALRTAGSLET